MNKKKYSTYNLNGDYGIGYTTKGDEFYFDLEDYDKIKDICWCKLSNGYITGWMNKDVKRIPMHQLIMDDKYIDHINHCRHDNRKYNLRLATGRENSFNKGISKNNNSGIIGVFLRNDTRNGEIKWRTQLNFNGRKVLDKTFDNIDDAIVARLNAEKNYFGEFSPQIYLFEKYNIK